jgi:hypothetical protein
VLDTRDPDPPRRGRAVRGGQTYDMESRSLAMFRVVSDAARAANNH